MKKDDTDADDCCRVFAADSFGKYSLNASGFIKGWKYDIFCRCIIHLDICILCDGAGCTGYVSALVIFLDSLSF